MSKSEINHSLPTHSHPTMRWTATISEILQITAAQPINLPHTLLPQIAQSIQTDTRLLQPGEIFLALRGETFDGHDFVTAALAQGALAAIVDDKYQYHNPNLPLLQVPNTLKAYQQLGRAWRDRFHIPIIGITGSVGKTTTKELISAVLATQGKVHKTYANFNNEIGVPKTLLQLGTEDNYAVIEMAMRGRGQIAKLTHIARPTIGVITNVGTAHIELLGSEQAIAEAKCELLANMPKDSIAILNNDNKRLIATAAQNWSGEVITYGLEGGDIQGELIDNTTIKVAGMLLPLPLPGRHNASNFLAALAVAKVLNLDWSALQAGVIVNMPTGRSQRFTLPGDVLILDETYNAAPEAMTAALELLADTPGQRKIAILGAMRELGDKSRELHQQIGATVQKLQLDALLVLADGQDTEALLAAAPGVPKESFSSHKDLITRLQTFIQPGDRLLFKAAHSVGLDQVVNHLTSTMNKT